jgi:phage terminase large subunit
MGIVELCHRNAGSGAVLTICRKTLPALKATAMRDFFEICEKEGIYDPAHHNKTDATYILYGNLVEFISIDQPQKVRGRKRDFLFLNEANEIGLEDWRQLVLRTTGRIVLDYNPSDAYSWIYTHVLTRTDASFFKTTYLDNPFLPESVVEEIERLRQADPNFWRVYGLGERAELVNAVYNHWKEVSDVPAGAKLIAYGLDFGFTNDPSALVAVYEGDGYIFDELLYSPNMTNMDLVRAIRDLCTHGVPVVADSAEPKSIEEIRRAGINIVATKKGADSVRARIDHLRSKPMAVTSRSTNGIKELRAYTWQITKDGNPTNFPVDANNHFLDAARYGASWKMRRPNYGSYAIG